MKTASVFEYENYRLFLRDTFEASKRANNKFSHRYFARLCGFSAANFMMNVILGKRNLSEDSIPKVARALHMNKEESEFFQNLVLFNQAKSLEERRQHAKLIVRSRVYRKTHPLRESQFEYFSKWYFVPIRELVTLESFQDDPDWIAKTLVPRISPMEAKKALEKLLALGLLKRNESGRLVQSEAHVSTGNELASVSLGQCHRELLKRASECIDSVPREKRDISALTVAVSEETAKHIKEMIQNFRKEIVDLVSREEAATDVYQVNFQLFPIARADGGQK